MTAVTMCAAAVTQFPAPVESVVTELSCMLCTKLDVTQELVNADTETVSQQLLHHPWMLQQTWTCGDVACHVCTWH